MKYYDYIISLGHCCHVAIVLKELFLKGESDVFDWSGGNLFDKCGIGGFEGKVNLICNNFENFLNLEDFEEFKHATNNKHKNVRNRKTGLQYLHDFPIDETIEEEFPSFKQRYQRRIDRLYRKIQDAEKICFVFVTRTEILPIETVLKAEKKLNELFNNKIDLLIIQHKDNLKQNEYIKTDINKHITCVYFNNLFITNHDGRMNKEAYSEIIEKNIMTKHKINNFKNLYKQKKIAYYSEFVNYFRDKLTDLEILKFSSLFDEKWYRKTYSINKNEDCAYHYLNYGWKMGFNPSLDFDGNKYLELYSDVKNANICPLLHYIKWGNKEGRKIEKVNNN